MTLHSLVSIKKRRQQRDVLKRPTPGAPFDTGTSYRPGARFGPSGIRQGSRRLNL